MKSHNSPQGAPRIGSGALLGIIVLTVENNLDEIAFWRLPKLYVRKLDGMDNLLSIAINDASAAARGVVCLALKGELLNQNIEVKHI